MEKSKKIVILGAGTAGTILANRLVKCVRGDLIITVIDHDPRHIYQPGLLFLPFGLIKADDIIRDTKDFIPKGVNLIQKPADRIAPDQNIVVLSDGVNIPYDVLIIATGAHTAPEETPGLKEDNWRKCIFDFYNLEGSIALAKYLQEWPGGRLVVHINEMPIKCPVVPLEFSFLADDYFKKKRMRKKVEIIYVTPLTGAFTKPKASEKLGYLLSERNINVVPDFYTERINNDKKTLVSFDGTEIPFDLLVTIPTNKGSEVIGRSGLGDELWFADTDHNTLQSKAHSNIFVVGDATNVPAPKAGSTAHFECELLEKNILLYLSGQPLLAEFDGHANCFIESGGGKALLIDYNYTFEPSEGKFPFAGIGPFKLLKESRLNHIGKKMFRLIYWHILLKARPLPFVPAKMKLTGKKIEKVNA